MTSPLPCIPIRTPPHTLSARVPPPPPPPIASLYPRRPCATPPLHPPCARRRRPPSAWPSPTHSASPIDLSTAVGRPSVQGQRLSHHRPTASKRIILPYLRNSLIVPVIRQVSSATGFRSWIILPYLRNSLIVPVIRLILSASAVSRVPGGSRPGRGPGRRRRRVRRGDGGRSSHCVGCLLVGRRRVL